MSLFLNDIVAIFPAFVRRSDEGSSAERAIEGALIY
jgi:hypothetical protein